MPNDNAESRVYAFNGKKLKLKFKEAVDCCNETIPYPPGKGETFLVGQNIVTTNPNDPNDQGLLQEFYCLAKIGSQNGKEKLLPLNLPRQDVKAAISSFSRNGKWLLRTGSYGYFEGNPSVDDAGIHNILLFKVL